MRFSQEVAEDYQLIFAERGAHTFVATHDGHPYVAPFSGNIIELCPVGALTSQPYRFRARPWDIEGAGGICTLCPSQCNVTFTVRDEKVLRVLARDHSEVDDGWLCDKGRFAYQAIHVDERITEPLVRDGGELRAVSWERALEVADGLARHKGHVGALAGGQATNEEGFLLQRLMREGLGSTDIDSRVYGPTPIGLARGSAVRRAAGHRPRPRVRPHGAPRRLRAARRRPDPRPSDPQGRPPARRATGDRLGAPERARSERPADRALRPRRGGGVPGRARRSACGRARGRRPNRRKLLIPRDGGEDVVIVWGERLRRRRSAALLEIAEHSDSPTRAGAGLLEIPAGANGRGLREAGVLPTPAPATPSSRTRAAAAAEIAQAAADGEITALYLLQTDPVRDYPNRALWEAALHRVATRGRARLGADRRTEGARERDLPGRVAAPRRTARSCIRTDGSSGCASAIAHPGSVRAGWSVIAEVARRAGLDTGVLTSPMAFGQLVDAVPFYKGLTLEEIGGRGVRWPVRDEAASIPAPAHTRHVPARPGPPKPASNGALRLGTYRPIWASPEVEVSPALHYTIAHQQLELSPDDALRLGITQGETVEVTQNGTRLKATRGGPQRRRARHRVPRRGDRH